MKHNLFVLILAVFMAFCVGTQPAMADQSKSKAVANQKKLQASIVKHAEQMQREFMAGNIDAFITYVHPDLVEMMGGPATIKSTMEPDLSEMISTIEKASIGNVSEVLEDNDQLVAFVSVETHYKFPEGKIIQTTYRIACSGDKGASWTFMDGQGRKDQEDFFRKTFPVLTNQILFPKCDSRQVK